MMFLSKRSSVKLRVQRIIWNEITYVCQIVLLYASLTGAVTNANESKINDDGDTTDREGISLEKTEVAPWHTQ